MIFPPVRISQLSRDLEEKRAALNRSTEGLKRTVRRKLSPIHLLIDNPKWFLGAAASIISAGSIGRMVLQFLGTRKNDRSKNGSKSSLLGSFLRFGGRTIYKTLTPLALGAVTFALKTAFRSFRNREA